MKMMILVPPWPEENGPPPFILKSYCPMQGDWYVNAFGKWEQWPSPVQGPHGRIVAVLGTKEKSQ